MKDNSVHPISSQVKLSYNGNDFLLDIAEGNMISLNAIYEIADSPENQDPNQWKRLPKTQELIETLANKLNMGLSHIIKTKRGKGGGTWAHWQLAVAYAKYLSPEFHLAVNEVFKERLEEELNPELGINRARERADRRYDKLGRSEKWKQTRRVSVDVRHFFTDTLKEHEVTTQVGYAICTNALYLPMFGATASQLKVKRGLPKKASLRDMMDLKELAATLLAETLATEDIEVNDLRGTPQCKQASKQAGEAVKLSLDTSNRHIKGQLSKI
jgi:hypothetical protein